MSKSILTFCMAVMLVSVAALGADTTWTLVDPDDVLTGDWSTPGNWDNGAPEAGDDVYLTSTLGSYVVNMNDNAAPKIRVLTLGNDAGKTVTLNLNANVLSGDPPWAFLDARLGSVVNVYGKARLGAEASYYGKLAVKNGGYLLLRTQGSGGQRNFWAGPGSEFIVEEGGQLDFSWLHLMLAGGAGVQMRVSGLLKMDSEYIYLHVGYGGNGHNEFRVENSGIVQNNHAKAQICVGESTGETADATMTLADNGTVLNRGSLIIGRIISTGPGYKATGRVNVEGGEWTNDGVVHISGVAAAQDTFTSSAHYAAINGNAAWYTEYTKGTLTVSDGKFTALANVYVANGASEVPPVFWTGG